MPNSCKNLIIFVFMFFVTFSLSYAEDINFGYRVDKSAEYFIDKTNKIHFSDIVSEKSDIEFQKNRIGELKFGYSEYTYWVRFKLDTKSFNASSWFLEFDYAPLDDIALFIPDLSGGYLVCSGGDRNHFNDCRLKYKNTVFILGNNVIDDKYFYVRVRTQGSVHIPIKLWKDTDFADHATDLHMGSGVYFGIIIALIVYNLFFFIFFRDVVYLLYVVLVSSVSLCWGSYNGIMMEYLWPDSIEWTSFALIFFATLSFFSLSVFSNFFLKLKHSMKFAYKILIGFSAFNALMFALLFVLPYRYASILLAIGGICLLVSVYVIALVRLWQGFRAARYFILASTFFIFGFLVMIFKLFGLLPHNFITEYSVQIGSALEGLLLSIALADRINTIRDEKEEAQELMLVQLEESEKIKSEYLEKSEELVKMRTAELEKANKKLESLATTDWLTGLTNKRIFEEVASKQFAQAKRNKIPISLLMIDIDNFKLYNDLYGHQAGDKCLAKVAEKISETATRTSDTVARYGGEEIAVILWETNENEAEIIAEKIKKSIENLGVDHGESPFGVVTVSIGVAGDIPEENCLLEDLIKKADEALYSAKKNGKNRVAGYIEKKDSENTRVL